MDVGLDTTFVEVFCLVFLDAMREERRRADMDVDRVILGFVGATIISANELRQFFY